MLEDALSSKLCEEKSTDLSGPQTNKTQQNKDGISEEAV